MTLIKRREINQQALNALKGISPILQRVFAARGINSRDELDTALKGLHSFKKLKDISKAVLRLEQALKEQQKVLIVGDFDADGATSTAVAISALKTLGFKHVEYLVPNRFEYGYGLTPEIVEVARRWNPSLIITVDNGIASLEGVIAANNNGIDVLVTDHHLAGDELPQACAIINPNQPGCEFPSKCIAGVGVIFYLMLAFRRHLVDIGWFTSENTPNMSQFLDLVALGTVADVVQLDKNNRILVQQGLNRIKQGKARPGILALLKIANRDPARVVASDMGFAIGPRLNAAGRLDDMSLGIECLLASDLNKALSLANELDGLNQERKQIEDEMKAKAMANLNAISLDEKQLPLGLCLFDETWHQGVIGILAGRIKEKTHRPVIAFAKVDEYELKGSARSIPGLHIRDALDAVAKKHPELLSKFGGHAMAAGLSIQRQHFSDFKQAFIDEINAQISHEQCIGELITDGPLEQNELKLDTAKLIKESCPWGQGFPEPLFDNTFELIEQRIVGGKHLKLSLCAPDTGQVIDAIAFNIDDKKWPDYRARAVQVIYRLDVNFYQGRSKLQLMVEHLNPVYE
jgi:single-stranded-DNA-specific exonuclease